MKHASISLFALFISVNLYCLKMSTRTSNSVTLLDLNQDVFHVIFGYIDRHHLCFSVKNVCKAMKVQVESFMPASKKCLFVDQSSSSLSFISIVIVYMFEGRSNPSFLCERAHNKCSLPKPINSSKESVTWVEPVGFFGGVMQERVIAGYFCVEKISKPRSLHHIWERFGRKRSSLRRFSRLVPYLYEYEESTDTWKSILPHKSEQMECIKYEHKVQGELSFSQVGNAIIVGLRMKANCQLNEFGYPVYTWKQSRIAQFHFYTNKDSLNITKGNRSMIEYSVSLFKIPLQIEGENLYYTVSSKNSNPDIPDLENENIYLHGFNIINREHNFFICRLQSRLFKLNVLNDEVRYHKLPPREGRKKKVSFKLKSFIYTIGLFENKFNLHDSFPESERYIGRRRILPKWKCDRYDIDRDQYFPSENDIPCFVNDIYSAETDSIESYALILTNVGLIKFTTKNGFEYDENLKNLEIKLSEHIDRWYYF